MAHPHLLCIKTYKHKRHLLCDTHLLDLKMENNTGKAMVREIGMYIFPATLSDFEKVLHKCQAPLWLPQVHPGSRYSPREDAEWWWESRHGGPLTFYCDCGASLRGNKHSNPRICSRKPLPTIYRSFGFSV